jgi:hypothetical protein
MVPMLTMNAYRPSRKAQLTKGYAAEEQKSTAFGILLLCICIISEEGKQKTQAKPSEYHSN